MHLPPTVMRLFLPRPVAWYCPVCGAEHTHPAGSSAGRCVRCLDHGRTVRLQPRKTRKR